MKPLILSTISTAANIRNPLKATRNPPETPVKPPVKPPGRTGPAGHFPWRLRGEAPLGGKGRGGEGC